MPIIVFRCKSCGEEFEDFRNIKEKEEKGFCIACGSREIERVETLQLGCDCGCGCGGESSSGCDC